ncbi:hypothetical protein XENOCAPTIV_016117, partial [Xenoophorus captivus]
SYPVTLFYCLNHSVQQRLIREMFLCSWYCVVQSQCCTTVPDRTLLCSESDCCAAYTKLY